MDMNEIEGVNGKPGTTSVESAGLGASKLYRIVIQLMIEKLGLSCSKNLKPTRQAGCKSADL